MPDETRRNLADLTNLELKELLRERGLPVTGNKNELILRLRSADPNIDGSSSPDEDNAAPVLVTEEQPIRPCEDNADSLLQREMDILRQERELLRRELQLLQRERNFQPTSRSDNSLTTQSTRYNRAEDILDAFQKITLFDTPKNEKDRKDFKKPLGSKTSIKEGNFARPKENRCFNCNEVGHLRTDCPKPRREWGSCYRCGSSEHRAKNCTQEASAETLKARPSEPSKSSTHLIQPTSPDTAFVAPISFTVSNAQNSNINYVLSAMIDSGSPVSLIKSSLLPPDTYSVCAPQDHSYQGLNRLPLQVFGVFQTHIQIDKVTIDIKFLVVPDSTMMYCAILGRDFILSPSIKVTLGRDFKIEKIDSRLNGESANFVGQIMQIEYVDKPESVAKDLDINPEIDCETRRTVQKLFNDENGNSCDSDSTASEIQLLKQSPADFTILMRSSTVALVNCSHWFVKCEPLQN
ncbi:hypothetical protein KPH14_001260 [Odynerus spinipes]|uniref:Uncharacterized protein n=1 Tax=Odynerus spinipes TaxID=1348599 RepID=A0AAD9R935_9HYME|nr:hypothetical protein KPH14_001260 [Odynerus spinipes]